MEPTINSRSPDLYQITLSLPLPGFRQFIGVWLYTGGPVILVDVGPTASVPQLRRALDRLGIRHLDAILLTHIHMDHAGGLGDVAAAFPDVPIVSHPKSIPHLVDPEKVWAGSLKTIGDLANAYGPITPVSRERLEAPDYLDRTGVETVMTPGHAPHHLCYAIGPYLFAGEAGGVCIELPSKEVYMRPATPPKFFMETFLESIDALVAIAPRKICYGHVGMFDRAVERLRQHQDQIRRWNDIIASEAPALRAADPREPLLEKLLAKDVLLTPFHRLLPDEQARERRFMLNSIAGFLEALRESNTA